MFKKNRKKGFSGESGQATVEYLLLLVVIIVLARFILTPLGEGLSRFSSLLIGPKGYYSCLMENGLIPGFEKIITKTETQDCRQKKLEAQANFNAKIQPIDSELNKFNRSQARRLRENGQSSDEASESEKRSPSSKRDRSARSSRSGSSAGQDTARGESSLSRLKKKRKKRRRRSRIGSTGGENSFESEYEKSRGRKKLKRKSKFKFAEDQGYLGRGYGEEEEEEGGRAPIFRRGKGKKSARAATIGKKGGPLVVGPKRGPDESLKAGKTEFQLGDFLKYFVIAAIIVAILLVIFSQVMEFQNRD